MNQNYGLRVDPRGLIQQLKNNLIDRYPRDSIFKELLQNADDARATRVEFGWSPGLTGADHALLRGPALFAVNDGPFKKNDEEAIRSFGLNYKATDRSTIGKFGLGLKSVFHLSEAFFFLASGESEAIDGERQIGSIVNPWCGTSFHTDWNQFVAADQALIKEFLAPLLNTEHWFVLWLPLRQEAHCQIDTIAVSTKDKPLRSKPTRIALHGDNPGDAAAGCPRELMAIPPEVYADLLPLLRHIERVRMWDRWTGSGSTRPRFQVALSPKAPRCQFPDPPTRQGDGAGVVSVEVEGVSSSLNYSIRQDWLSALSDFNNRPGWPTTMSLESVFQEPDPAVPHCAVSLSRWCSVDDGQLTISRAVFLPLRGGEVDLPCNGNSIYSLKLHGCFFVDAGRGQPVQAKIGGKDDDCSVEERVRVEWNDRLLKEGICKLVIPTLADFVLSAKLDDPAISALTKALGDSKFATEYRTELTQSEQWLYSWSSDEVGWLQRPATTDFLEIPDFGMAGPALAGEVLPGLKKVAAKATLTPHNFPRLTARIASEWPDDLLAEALEAKSVSCADWDDKHWDYLRLFLKLALPPEMGPKALVALTTLLRRLFASTAVHKLRKFKSFVQDVVCRLPTNSRLALPIPVTWSEQERQDVLEWPVALAIIPSEFDPPGAESTGKLTPKDAVELLTLLQPSCERRLTSEPAVAIIEATTDAIALRAHPGFVDLRLWVVDSLRALRVERVISAYSDLLLEMRKGLLFHGNSADLKLFAQALDGVNVYALPVANAQVLFRPDEIPGCALPGLVQVLATFPPLNADPSNRVGLLKQLLNSQRNEAIAQKWRQAVRYMLHNRPESIESNDVLLIGNQRTSGIWGRIARTYLEASASAWRVLPDEPLVSLLNPPQRAEIGIEEIAADGVAKLLPVDAARRLVIEFTNAEREDVLRGWHDQPDLLKALPLHDGLTGGRHRIWSDCYWQSRYSLDGPLAKLVTLLKLCSNPGLAAIQSPLAEELRPAVIISLALDAGPADHWAEIMNAIADAGILAKDVRERLASAKWLPLEAGSVVAPCQVLLDSDPVLSQEIDRLLSVAPEINLFGFAHLAKAIRDHKGKEGLRRLCSPSREYVLGVLAGSLSQAGERFQIGLRLDDDSEIEDWLIAFADSPAEIMPVRDLLNAAWQADKDGCASRFLPGLMPADRRATVLDSSRIFTLLNCLREQHDKANYHMKAKVRRVHDRYLGNATNLPNWPELLGTLQLLNSIGDWVKAGKLCVATGVEKAATLDGDHSRLLQGKVARQEPKKLSKAGPKHEPTLGYHWDAEWHKAADALEHYFTPWANESEACSAWVGALLAILGDFPPIKRLAAKFLPQGHSVEGVREAVNFVLRNRTEASGRVSADSPVDMMRIQRILLEVTELKPTIEVANLLGHPLSVRPASKNDDLFISYGIRKVDIRLEGDLQVHWLNLRQVDLKPSDSEVRRKWIEGTANRILREVYDQKVSTINEALPGLVDREHEVRTAQAVALNAQHTLRQLGHLASKELNEVLADFDRVVDRKAEEQVANEKGLALVGVTSESIEREARNKLRRLIESSQEIRMQLLAGLRRKLGEYRYRPQSVLFELFQNADDAAVELGDNGSGVFAVLLDKGTGLTAMHGGRPINRPGADGNREKAARDLRKMLALGHSDKGDESEPAVTGRFGLGFKSVFLLSDRPQLLSGQLGIEVLGGLYPKQLGKQASDELREALKRAGLSDTQGTACRLFFRENTTSAEVVSPYRDLAAYLAVFARKARRCRLIEENGKLSEATWDEVPLVNGTVLTGLLKHFNGSRDSTLRRAIVVRVGDAALLFGIDAHGFARLPEFVPSVWATAPTEERHDLGFVVNGPFALDVGRSQVDWNAKENSVLLERLGRGFGSGLVALFDAGNDEHWPQLQRQLGMVTGDCYSFWESFWEALTKNIACPEQLRNMMWKWREGAVAKFLAERCALPSGVPLDRYRTLTKIEDVQSVLSGSLDTGGDLALLRQVAEWPAFCAHEPGSLVSAKTWERLRELVPDGLPIVSRLDLASLIAAELKSNKCFDAERAERFGRVILRERSELRPLLTKNAMFRDRCGNWKLTEQLLLPSKYDDADYRDEAMRAAFAPPERVLADEYDADAIKFFLACRDQLVAPILEMADWAIDAEDDPKRRAGVKCYLSQGEQRYRLLQQLRPRLRGTWLENLTVAAIEESGEDRYTATLIMAGLGRLEASTAPFDSPIPPIQGGWIPQGSPETLLRRIADWWQSAREGYVRRYDDESVPNGQMVREIAMSDNDRTNSARLAWLRLFVGGILATLGRVRPTQNRDFMALCEDRGWFQILLDPESGSRDWLVEVESYLDEQTEHIQYFHWLRQFLGIAFTARHLDSFAASFRAINQIQGRFPFREILAIRASSQFAGSGLDAPPLRQVLGIGACAVLRELARGGVIRNAHAYPFCYPPVRRVRILLETLGWKGGQGYEDTQWETSRSIHAFLSQYLADPTFAGTFDLPFLTLADDRNREMRTRILGGRT